MIHQFEHNGTYIVLDIASGAVHTVDEIAYILCERLTPPLTDKYPQALLAALEERFLPSDLKETYEELFQLYTNGTLFSDDQPLPASLIKPKDTPIKALCLHVSHDCNLRCKYCFAETGDFGTTRSLMSADVAKAAIDFVIPRSQNRHNIEIDFFGGEPLMAWQTVKETVEYANEQAGLHQKQFHFTLTTNGMLLNNEIIDYINQNMDNIVLSLDGRKAVNDTMRITPNGSGSYNIILPKFKKLVESRSNNKDYYLRGTYTAKNLDFTADIMDIYANGFDQISIEPVVAESGCGYELKESDLPRIRKEYWNLAEKMLALDERDEFLNFFHFNVDLDQGPCIIKRLRGCGAGCEYLAVTPEGDIYPCHQFVGDQKFLMGNLMDGTFDKGKAAQFAGVSVYSREKCRDCWARFYCSGGCSASNYKANGDIDKSYELGCDLEKMRLEAAIYLAVKRAEA